MTENVLNGIKNRILQMLLRNAPGATSVRIWLNRWRGVKIGKNCWIGHDALIETSHPHLVRIGDNAAIGIRATIIAHFHEQQGVTIEDGATVGPGAIVMPNVVVGRESIITAGSVVTRNVPPRTMVQGNPAKPIAHLGVPITPDISLKEWVKNLRPIR